MEEVLGSCLGAEMGEETVEMGMVEGWGYPKVLWGGRVFFWACPGAASPPESSKQQRSSHRGNVTCARAVTSPDTQRVLGWDRRGVRTPEAVHMQDLTTLIPAENPGSPSPNKAQCHEHWGTSGVTVVARPWGPAAARERRMKAFGVIPVPVPMPEFPPPCPASNYK